MVPSTSSIQKYGLSNKIVENLIFCPAYSPCLNRSVIIRPLSYHFICFRSRPVEASPRFLFSKSFYELGSGFRLQKLTYRDTATLCISLGVAHNLKLLRECCCCFPVVHHAWILPSPLRGHKKTPHLNLRRGLRSKRGVSLYTYTTVESSLRAQPIRQLLQVYHSWILSVNSDMIVQ